MYNSYTPANLGSQGTTNDPLRVFLLERKFSQGRENLSYLAKVPLLEVYFNVSNNQSHFIYYCINFRRRLKHCLVMMC